MVTLKITRVPPVYPSQKVFMQDRFIEQKYLPIKKPRVSFMSILEKEMQGSANK